MERPQFGMDNDEAFDEDPNRVMFSCSDLGSQGTPLAGLIQESSWLNGVKGVFRRVGWLGQHQFFHFSFRP